MQDAMTRHPCWNPVLFQMPQADRCCLFYKVGPSPSTWWGMLIRSDDGGRTWSKPEKLPDDIAGPIKNKAGPAGRRPPAFWQLDRGPRLARPHGMDRRCGQNLGANQRPVRRRLARSDSADDFEARRQAADSLPQPHARSALAKLVGRRRPDVEQVRADRICRIPAPASMA